MSYLVFARKWRPGSFSAVVGQPHIVETLQRAIEKSRIAHAYLFSGTRGVGKTTCARILARALNCAEGPTANPCGVCENCVSIGRGNSFNLVEIDGASNNSVDNIRELRDMVGYSSMSGAYRVFIIDEVHMLSTGAFNALLKTLEEPPENVVFVLATTEPHKIPDTIHSRCQQFEFRPVSPETVALHLAQVCDAEGIVYEERALQLIADKANGSVRDSLSLLEQACSFCDQRLEEGAVRAVLGCVDSAVYSAILKEVSNGDALLAVAKLHEALGRGFDLAEFLTGFLEYLRELLFDSLRGDSGTAALFSEGDILRFTEMVRVCEKDIRFSSVPRFTVELLIVKMAKMDSTLSLAALLSKLESGAVVADAPPVEISRPQNQVDVAKPKAVITPPLNRVEKESVEMEREESKRSITPAPGEDISKYWRSIVENFSSQRPMLGAWLSLGRLVSSDDGAIILSFSEDCSFQSAELSRDENRKLIESFIAENTGRSYKLKFITDSEKPVQQDEPAPIDAEVSADCGDEVEVLADEPPVDPVDLESDKVIIEKIIEVFNTETVK